MSRRLLVGAFALTCAALGLAASTLPSVALPVPGPLARTAANADLVQVRMHRHSMRHRRMRRSSSSAGNANMPSRSGAAQQYGQTSGGPRR